MSKEISKKTELSPAPKNDGITWGPWGAIITIIVLFFIESVVASLVIVVYAALKSQNVTQATNWLSNSIPYGFWFTVFAETLIVAGVWFFIRIRKGNWRAIGLYRPQKIDAAYPFIGLVIYYPIYIIAVSILATLTKLNINQQQNVGFSQSTTGWPLILVFICLVILPPIAEEIAFRGFLYSGLKKSLPKIWAVIFTGIIFAIPHALESQSGGLLWIAAVDTFILSAVLCWLREKTGRLYAGMGLHALKNFIAFAYVFHIFQQLNFHF
ncbi:MAG TPA: type II CAAX endopeptidase family protein [Candidatus Saccharimonadales bacterium]|jgi:membrane protease YdiL (CAAX protease family)|nr:type II CAAX endopeptidase family protein [Candidatus Saccharimonadales bacterium]